MGLASRFRHDRHVSLTLARAQGLEAGLVSQRELSGLHHQRETADYVKRKWEKILMK